MIASTNSRPMILSHAGPCSTAVISEAVPKDSSTTIGHTVTSGIPTPRVPEMISVLLLRTAPDKITTRPARANIP